MNGDGQPDCEEMLVNQVTGVVHGTDVMPDGWIIHQVEPRDGCAVRVAIGPADGITCTITWAQPEEAPFQAYKRGVRYAASYSIAEKGVDDDITLTCALALCESLANHEGHVELRTQSVSHGGDAISLENVLQVLGGNLKVGLELTDRWTLASISEPCPDEVHLIFAHHDIPLLPKLIITQAAQGQRGGVVVPPYSVLYRTRFGLTAPIHVESYYRILAASLGDIIRAGVAP